MIDSEDESSFNAQTMLLKGRYLGYSRLISIFEVILEGYPIIQENICVILYNY